MNNKCENCNKNHDGSHGSGRFCSHNCRSSYAGKRVKNRHSNKGRKLPSKLGGWDCNYCDLNFRTRRELRQHKRENHQENQVQPGKSWNSGLTKETDNRIELSAQVLRNGYESGRLVGSFTTNNKKQIINFIKKALKNIC